MTMAIGVIGKTMNRKKSSILNSLKRSVRFGTQRRNTLQIATPVKWHLVFLNSLPWHRRWQSEIVAVPVSQSFEETVLSRTAVSKRISLRDYDEAVRYSIP